MAQILKLSGLFILGSVLNLVNCLRHNVYVSCTPCGNPSNDVQSLDYVAQSVIPIVKKPASCREREANDPEFERP
jgi:hypothetical protein